MGDLNKNNEFDAIVIGSGVSGGYSAMELCKKGYKTVMIERGRMVKHGQDYPTALLDDWDMPNQGKTSLDEKEEKYFKQNKLHWCITEQSKHFFNRDDEYSYDEDKPFAWIRKFIAPFPLNCAEKKLREAVKASDPNRVVTAGRVANLSEYNPEVHKGHRGKCLARNRCQRGCPFGAYFSTQSATLPVAEETGNLPQWLRQW